MNVSFSRFKYTVTPFNLLVTVQVMTLSSGEGLRAEMERFKVKFLVSEKDNYQIKNVQMMTLFFTKVNQKTKF